MFDFEEAILGLSERLQDVALNNNTAKEDDLQPNQEPQLPSAQPQMIQQLQQDDGSTTSSQYNSDTDEPAPRQKPLKQQKIVALDQDYIASYSTEASTLVDPLTVTSSSTETRIRKVGKDDFKSLCVLGRGAFGKVHLVRHEQSQQLYAMKILKKASLIVQGKQANQVKTERQILEEVRHPFIVKLYYAFQTPDDLHMVLEYAVGGELFRHLTHEGMFSEPMARFYAAELVLALDHLHSLGIVYRDLKPENCLLDAQGHIILTDFGLSKVSMDGKTNTICGTIEYMAPEILMGLDYDHVVDWWSLGILLYDMLTGSPPFSGQRKKTMDAILSKKIYLPYYLTSDAKDLLSKLLRKNPNARLGAKPKRSDAVRKHRFFSKIHWKDLENRKVTPPICPVVTNPEAAENFDPQFTNQTIGSSSNAIYQETQAHFRDFSFVDASLVV
ncbi:kinase-like domain-containing protein [Halteromyces radiatus]|uniref:kinase-like domain-containing protein n=1 Tax=Halteromyces radiatus TaxID=101107 RepID=UPI0022204981|nr:kinase-like domain-containing protein [Halteromyces radiatus]KAI8099435.1 kinase-like domain-containing protein [Halteromyces radiatus]